MNAYSNAKCSECELPEYEGHRVGCPNRVKTTTKKPLYCIAYEKRVRPKVWIPQMTYVHADTDAEARGIFFNSDSPEVMGQNRIVGIAPVIGYFVNDTKGDVLSV